LGCIRRASPAAAGVRRILSPLLDSTLLCAALLRPVFRRRNSRAARRVPRTKSGQAAGAISHNQIRCLVIGSPPMAAQVQPNVSRPRDLSFSPIQEPQHGHLEQYG
jgi:hypothetical protein